ncbi:MAG TPA: hypothetical protein PLG58_06900, partial [Flexilinea sp.]|nr:hypothetical protein [Flexilinea sp.]
MNTFKKKAAPYLYLSPTIILMIVLMLIPIVMVISYSVMNNVIMNKNPIYIGLGNYKTILTDEVFHTTIYNTLFFTVGSVVMHMVIGLLFAMLLNSR